MKNHVLSDSIDSVSPDNAIEGMDEFPVNPSMSFYLSEKQIIEFSQKAEKGDGEPAFRLYLYFLFLVLDLEKGHYWLEISAKNGHTIAQYSIAALLYSEKKFEEALYWAKMAKLSGSEDADRLIDKICIKMPNICEDSLGNLGKQGKRYR
jgi:TPR repeat protein